MSTIRPPVWPQNAQTPAAGARPAPDAAKLAAQRAFFAAALGQAAPSGQAAQTATTAPIKPPEPVQRAAPAVHQTFVKSEPEPTVTRIPRPGSLVNILV